MALWRSALQYNKYLSKYLPFWKMQIDTHFKIYNFFLCWHFLLVFVRLPQISTSCNTAFYSLLSYFLAGRVVSAFHGSCDPGGAPAQWSVCVLNVPPWTALYSGWASACLSLACMWEAGTWLALLYCNLPQPARIQCPAESRWFEGRKVAVLRFKDLRMKIVITSFTRDCSI